MAQITSVTSESLQAQIRRLLPSQVGFGEDLQATNVISPVIDLTPTAEGSQLGQNLQTAVNHGQATVFDANDAFINIVNTAGFYEVTGNATAIEGTGGVRTALLRLNDGSTNKVIYELNTFNTSYTASYTDHFKFVIFLLAGESCVAGSNDAFARITGTVRQIADVNGNLVNPTGFTFE